MRYFSTFSGIGGFEIGITKAHESLCNAYRSENRGSKENKERNEGQRFFTEKGKDACSKEGSTCKCSDDITHERPLCVGYSEIDKYASAIYQKHFPNHTNYGDITKINAEQLPDFDLLVGGFPCQSFSIAGKRGGFNDTRGTLFFDLARILRAKQPRLFVFENVKGLLSHDNGNTFRTIIATIDELGYDCQWQVLNSKNHGVPQNRERIFIVGHLRGTPRPEVFPFGEVIKENTRTDEDRTSKPTQAITSQGGLNARGTFVQTSYALDANYWKGTNTIEKSRRQVIASNMRIRRLTPVECERLQGFPDGWTEGVSDTQRYKTLGNAVTTNVIRDVMQKIL